MIYITAYDRTNKIKYIPFEFRDDIQLCRGLDKLYSINDHLLESLEASIRAHLLHAIIIFFCFIIECNSHNFDKSDVLNVSNCVFLQAILFSSFSDLNCITRNHS